MRKKIYSCILIMMMITCFSLHSQTTSSKVEFKNNVDYFRLFTLDEIAIDLKDRIVIKSYFRDSHLNFSFKEYPNSQIEIKNEKVSENVITKSYIVSKPSSSKSDFNELISIIENCVECNFTLMAINEEGQRIYTSKEYSLTVVIGFEEDKTLFYALMGKFYT